MDILTVAQFNKLLNSIFSDLGEFTVEGEIAQMGFSKNNAVFIDLKDLKENALLKVSNYAPYVKGINSVEEGMHVLVTGGMSVYSPSGSVSLKVRKIEPMGEGALKAALEKLKKVLKEEGLFDLERKRNLPDYITRIALITGKDSAAYHDFIKIIQEYKSAIEIISIPCLVQGDRAEGEIVRALKHSQNLDIDVIVLIRGGGSLEDLKVFNSEEVARAIFSSRIPVIAGVGHEVDTSIADMVADVRASTPSQAAYYLASQNQHFLDQIQNLLEEHETKIMTQIPSSIELQQRERFLMQGMRIIKNQLASIEEKIKIPEQIEDILKGYIKDKLLKIGNHQKLLNSYDHNQVLKRGYGLVEYEGKYISDPSELKEQDLIKILMHKGSFDSEIKKINLNS